VKLAWGPPHEVATVRRIFDDLLREVWRPSQIAKRLNADAISCRGGDWTARKVRAVLQNELVIGVLATGKSVWKLRERERRVAPEDWQRQTILPAMISQDSFREARRRLAGEPGHRHSLCELEADLRRLRERHGDLTRALVRGHGRFPVRAYVARFGSLPAAFRVAGFVRQVRDRQHGEPLDREGMVHQLRRLLEQTGYLSASLLQERGDVPSPAVLRRAFGSLDAAYAAVGFATDRSEQLRLAHRRKRSHPASEAPL
jgi:hypothetical protein